MKATGGRFTKTIIITYIQSVRKECFTIELRVNFFCDTLLSMEFGPHVCEGREIAVAFC